MSEAEVKLREDEVKYINENRHRCILCEHLDIFHYPDGDYSDCRFCDVADCECMRMA